MIQYTGSNLYIKPNKKEDVCLTRALNEKNIIQFYQHNYYPADRFIFGRLCAIK